MTKTLTIVDSFEIPLGTIVEENDGTITTTIDHGHTTLPPVVLMTLMNIGFLLNGKAPQMTKDGNVIEPPTTLNRAAIVDLTHLIQEDSNGHLTLLES